MILREEVCAKGGTKMEERIGEPAAGGRGGFNGFRFGEWWDGDWDARCGMQECKWMDGFAHSPSLCDSYGFPASRRMVRV